jgi:Rps23 Pro-64 3,4-dihydroxylase Tpa1-like proline 4-hydroxylase
VWLAGIRGARLLAWLWRAARKPRPLGGGELQRLQRTAEAMHSERFQPFD